MTKEKDMPKWASDLKDWGEGMEKKYGKRPRNERKENFISGIIGGVIAIFLLLYLPQFFPSFFQPGFIVVQYVAIVVTIIQIFCYMLLLAFSAKWFYRLGQALINALSVVSLVTMIVLFPFNMPSGLSIIVRFALSLVTVIVAITVPFYFVGGLTAIFE